jgi:hypothetical protein
VNPVLRRNCILKVRTLLLIPALAAVLAAAGDPMRSRTSFLADSGVSVCQLDRFVLVGTDSVFLDGVLQSRESYAFDAARGSLTFLVPLLKPTQVIVSYERLPLGDLKSVYRLRPLPVEGIQVGVAETTGLRAAPDTGSEPTSGDSNEPLALNGAKTITVSFGSNGLDLDQSLRLNVRGSIAGVRLDAALSDQGTGIGAEGSTRELDELDRVLIGLQGRNVRGSIGDIDLNESQGRLGTTYRRLRGAHVEAGFRESGVQRQGPGGQGSTGSGQSPGTPEPRLRVKASYARPKGRVGRNEFAGLDGRQGPYLLTGDLTGIVVVPGSERVFLDGTQLVRGWDYDYTIDYDLGELTFTNRHQIVARSRIEVNFEYTTDEYQRDVLSGGAAYDFGFARFGGGAFREGDDPNAHLGRAFTRTETDSLAAAGDTGVAWLSGADSVGFGSGDYVRRGDHFEFAGRDSGDFSVRFTLLGDSAGDYEYDNSIAGYRYVGIGQGRYVARQQVRLPERSEAYHIDASYQFLPGLDAEFTGMLSRRSRNLFAPGGSRSGLGYDGMLGWQRDAAGIRYERRSLGTAFSLPGQSSERDIAYTWGLTAVPAVYTRDQLSAYARPWVPVRLDLGLGWLRSAAGNLDRKRGVLGARVFFADYSLERVARLTRHAGGLQPRVGSFFPAVRVRFDDDTLSRRFEATPEFGWRPRDELQLRLSWQQVREAARDSVGRRFSEQSRLNTWRGDWRMATVRNLDVQAIAGYQQRRAFAAGVADFDQLFGSLVSSYSNPTGLRLRVSLDQKYTQEAARQVLFVPADSGRGEYSRNPETGEYYPDTLGRYRRVLVNSGRTVPTRQSSADLSGGFLLGELLNISLAGRLEQDVGDSATLADNWSGTGSLELLPNSRELTVVVSDDISSSFDQRFAEQPEHDFRNQASLELRTSAGSYVTGKVRLELPLRRRTTDNGILEQRESGWQGWVFPFVGAGLDVELTGGYGERVISMPLGYPSLGEFTIRTLTLGLRRRFALPAKTALTAEARADRRSSTVNRLPYEVALTDPMGWSEELSLNLDRALGSILVLTGSYAFHKRPDRASDHAAGVSLKAYF